MGKLLVVLWLVCSASVAAADRVDRLEPASWWVGMHDDQLQLLVHGARVADLQPQLAYPGVAIRNVERTENPNYLFITLTISPQTRPGSFPIDFLKRGRTVATRNYTLDARVPDSAQRVGFGPQDAIYLITPDRFANGDPTNDSVVGMRDRLDRSKPLGRHGGDLLGIRNHLDYLSGMGFTQLWLNPVQENDQPEYSYHGYAITDFYRVDRRLGTNADYRALAGAARQRGIGLIMDVVLNHCGSEHWWVKDPPSRDWFNNGGRFSPTTHVREALNDVHGSAADRRAFTDGWFVPAMPDLNQRNPLLARYLIQNSIWWIEYAGLSGLRIDTWSYSDRGFLAEWSRRVMQEYPRLNMVGEEWTTNPTTQAYWQRGSKPADGYQSSLPSLFDFPLQEAVVMGLRERQDWGAGLRRIYRVVASDHVYPDPYNLVVFLDNHDMSRVFTAVGARADLDRMALALLLTIRGIPQIFYGTEIMMGNPGTEDHGVIRSDFPGGWPGDSRNAFTGQGLTAAESSTQTQLRQLLQWRRAAPAIRDGKLTHFVPLDDVYVYFRHNDAQKLMVILNNSDQSRTVATDRFAEIIGTARTGTDVLTSQVHELERDIVAPARTATILELR